MYESSADLSANSIPANSQAASSRASRVTAKYSAESARKPDLNPYFGVNPLSIRLWTKLDWVAFFLLLFLGMYAVGSLAKNGETLRYYNHPISILKPRPQVFHIAIMVAAAVILFLGVVAGILYLHFLRNLLGYLLTLIGLTMAAILLLILLIYMIYLISDSDELENSVFANVRDQMSNIGFKYSFFALQSDYQCCGVRTYEDWSIFNIHATLDQRTLPLSCLKEKLVHKNYTWGGLLALDKKSIAWKNENVNTKGCSSVLCAYHYNLYTNYLFEYLSIILLIIIYLILLTILFCRWYQTAKLKLASRRKGRRGPRVILPDDVTIPGSEYPTAPQTPMTTKSMISSNNIGFYAP